MLTRSIKLAVVGLLFLVSTQSAEAQFRGRGGFGGGGDDSRSRYGGDDRGGSDRDREEMRRRFEEMRSRYSGGGDRDGNSRFGSGGFRGFGGSDQDREEMRRRFEEMRSRYGGGDRGRDDGDRGRDDGDRSRYDRSRSGDDRGRGNDRSNSLFVPKPHDPIGVQLPGNYVDGDADGDGQIALVEWRRWRPQEIASFMMMDSNKDGLLTARELIIAENNGTQMAVATPSDDASREPTPTPTSSRSDADGNKSGEKASAAEARYVFKALDKDKDGKISSGEWSGSKSVREGFEKAGIKLDLPVDLDTFLDRYPPYRIIPQLRLR